MPRKFDSIFIVRQTDGPLTHPPDAYAGALGLNSELAPPALFFDLSFIPQSYVLALALQYESPCCLLPLWR